MSDITRRLCTDILTGGVGWDAEEEEESKMANWRPKNFSTNQKIHHSRAITNTNEKYSKSNAHLDSHFSIIFHHH